MKTKWLLTMGGLLLGAAMLLGLPGCEGSGSPDTGTIDSYFANNPFVSDPRDPTLPHDVIITPSSATIVNVGDTAVFTAKGGTPAYHWDVVNGNGSINPSTADGGQAIYTAGAAGPNTVIAYDVNGHAGMATISAASNAVYVLQLTVTPTAILTTNNPTATCSVYGGLPPYTWTVSDVTMGHITPPATGANVTYTRLLPGGNSVIVSDSAGNRTSAAISQP